MLASFSGPSSSIRISSHSAEDFSFAQNAKQARIANTVAARSQLFNQILLINLIIITNIILTIARLKMKPCAWAVRKSAKKVFKNKLDFILGAFAKWAQFYSPNTDQRTFTFR